MDEDSAARLKMRPARENLRRFRQRFPFTEDGVGLGVAVEEGDAAIQLRVIDVLPNWYLHENVEVKE